MNQNEFPKLNTKRLNLLRMQEGDWKVISFLRSDKTVNEFVQRPMAETKEKALAFISKIDNGIDNGVLYYWKIAQKNHEQMIGTICLWNISDDQKTAEVGFDLNPGFHRQGIMNESLNSVIQFGFNQLSLESIEAYTHEQNLGAVKLLEKNGFKLNNDKRDPDNTNNIVYQLINPHF